MLTLTQSRRTDSVTIFRDFILSDGQLVFTNIFYVLPDSPRLSRNASGGPAFDFLWYRPAIPGDTAAGGMATLALELSPAPDQAAALTQIISTGYNVPAGSIEIRSVPFKGGSVQLTYAGASDAGEFATQIAGNGPAQLIGAERATFIVDLSSDGAALLWKAIDQHLRLFHLRYDLVFDHRLASVHMRVWCNVAASLKAADSWIRSGGSDPAQLRASLISASAAGIEITSEQPLPADQQETLQKSGQELLDRALGSTLFSPNDKKAAPNVLPYSSAMESALNFSLDESYPLEQHAISDALLDIVLTPEQAAAQIRKVDLSNGFFSILDVQIVCTIDFTTDLISLVRAKIMYDQTGASGRVQRSGEFVFKQGNDLIQHFRTDLAAPGKTTCDYSIDVFYRGDHVPFHIDRHDVDNTALVLDLDAAGILDVAIELSDVPFDKVSSAVVDLIYPSKQLTSQLILNGKAVSGRWQAVISETPQPWKYKVTWVLSDGRRLDGAWTDSTSSTVYLNAPPELRAKIRVQVIAAGDFSALTQIVVDLRSLYDSSSQKQISLTASGQTQLWEASAGPDLINAYQYRRTLVYKDGRNQVLDADWVSETRPVLPVADTSTFHLQIIPKLLDLGGSLRMVILELESEPVEPDKVERKTLIVRTRTEQPEWSFSADAPDKHKYRYRLTPVPTEGDRPPEPEWRESDAAILVLQIPPN